MPEPWYFEDVVRNEADAEWARTGLAHAAASLAEALRIVEQDVPVIVEDWFGQARSVFDQEMPVVLEAGHQLLATLYASVAAVAYHDELAGNEALRRRFLRRQWHFDDLAAGEVEG